MPISAGDFVSKLATMVGIPSGDSDLVGLLSSSEFANFKIPDELSKKIQSNIVTMEAAKNNEQLRKHFHSEIYNGLDNNLNGLMDKLGLDPEMAASIRAEKKTTEKYNRLIEKMKTLQEKKADSTTKADRKQVEDEISKLNNQIIELSQKLEKAPTERDQFWSEKLKSKAIQNVLASYNYAGEKDIPKDVLIETASVLLNKKLLENGIRIEYNPDTDSVGLKTESGMDFYKDNSPISFKSFADSVLSESKMLNIPGASAPTTIAAQPSQPSTTIISGSGKSVDASKFYAAFDEVANGR